MRFCIVSTFYPPYNFGGDGIYAYRLANGLARLGHDVTVLHSPTAYEQLAKRQPTVGYDDHENVHVRAIRTPLGKLGLLAVQQLGSPCFQGPALHRHLSEGAFDVIHYNNVSLLGGPRVFRYGRGLKLCTLIEHWLVCPMHVLWKFDREVCRKPSCVACTLHGKRPPQLWRYTGLMKRATRAIDAFIGPSLFTMDMHRTRGLKGTMIQLPLFHPQPRATSDDALLPNDGRAYFFFVGRLEKIKGVQNLIPVFRDWPDVDLLIAGDGNYAEILRKQAKGVSNIKFVGRLGANQLHTYYRHAHATLVPSLCYETFGIIVAESFCASTPVIVYAQSSLKELVETHGGGLTYETEQELKTAIHRMMNDEGLRKSLGAQGRRAYEAEFAEDSFLAHYLNVVNELLERKRAGQLSPTSGRGEGDLFAGRPVFY